MKLVLVPQSLRIPAGAHAFFFFEQNPQGHFESGLFHCHNICLACLSPLQDQDTRRDGQDLKKKSESRNA
jgi:hypothetical protein